MQSAKSPKNLRLASLSADRSVKVMAEGNSSSWYCWMAQAVIGLAHGDSFALRDEDLNFMVMLAVSQGMKVAMEAWTRQQTEFLWTTIA